MSKILTVRSETDLTWGESLWEVLKTKVGTYISFTKVFCTVKLKMNARFIFSHRQEANMFSYVFCCSLHWFILFEVIFRLDNAMKFGSCQPHS